MRSLLPIVDTIEIRSDAITAARRPFTEKPVTTRSARRSMTPFRTKLKSPRVIIVIGRVNTQRIGRTSALRRPSASAVIAAASIPVMLMPG
jgi:hypothetical protein